MNKRVFLFAGQGSQFYFMAENCMKQMKALENG